MNLMDVIDIVYLHICESIPTAKAYAWRLANVSRRKVNVSVLTLVNHWYVGKKSAFTT